MRNQYKRSDVFTCSNQAHIHFDKKVSVYHVLKVKQCYPDGCVYFYWKCRKLNKGEPCHRKYEHVGKKCFGCKEFYDEKITNQLQVNLDKDEWNQFQEALEDFEDWLELIRGKTLPIYGKIDSVKPYLTTNGDTISAKPQLKGFMLTFRECFIDRTHFDDFAFATISVGMYKRYRFSPGDRFDFLATVNEDHGRIVFQKLRRIEFDSHQDNPDWDETETLVTLSTANELSQQQEKCHYCPHGVLVDEKTNNQRDVSTRKMYCLAGVEHPDECVLPALEKLSDDVCAIK